RTMNTYLGAAQNLTPSDLDEKQIAAAGITYPEGYLWDPPQAKEAFRKAATIAHGAGRKVALTLSDAFCVGRDRDEFLNLMRTGAVDLILANESELKSLYETSECDSEVVPVTPFAQDCSIVACTATDLAAIVDPGGDLSRIMEAIDQLGVTPERILLTHGHIDHAGAAADLADALSVPIEGPHEADAFLL